MPQHFWIWIGSIGLLLILTHLINRALDALFMDNAAAKISERMQSN